MTPVPPRRVVAELTRLARRSLSGDPPLSDQFAFQRLQHRLAGTQMKRSLISQGALAMAGALVVAMVLWLGLGDRSEPITYQVLNGNIVSGYVLGSADTRLRFSDGSDVSLARGAETKVEELSARGGRFNVRKGSVRFAIAHLPNAAWSVKAGPYTVQVTGTAFDVRWSNAEQELELVLHSGSVNVTGPRGNVKLRPGQRFVGAGDGRVTVEGPRIHAANTRAPTALPAPASELLEPTSPAPADVESPSKAGVTRAGEASAQLSWSRQVAQGNFAAVIAEAERRGLEKTLSTASLAEVSALADAARYGQRGAIASRALLALRQRFAGSSTAREAAFLLGRIAESNGGAASEWYDRYLQESPTGPYASQALGRKMMLLYKRGGAAAARPLASEYLGRFAAGPYASAAKKVLREGQSPIAP